MGVDDLPGSGTPDAPGSEMRYEISHGAELRNLVGERSATVESVAYTHHYVSLCGLDAFLASG